MKKWGCDNCGECLTSKQDLIKHLEEEFSLCNDEIIELESGQDCISNQLERLKNNKKGD